jgi:Leucine-rich repeat (LRR) protein
MRKPKLFLAMALLFTLGVILSGCSKTAENEYLPEYCQTYAGFADTASRDLYELIEDNTSTSLNPNSYFGVISGTTELEFEVNEPNRTIDLGGIQCFQNLTSLTLIGSSFKDISEISALKNIQTIQLSNTSVISIDSFKNLSKIKELVLNNNSALQSVQGVEEMTKLTFLDLSDNGIVNIEGLNNLVNLETLILRNNEIIELPTIDSLTNLVTLDVSNNNLRVFGEDLSGLENLVAFNAAYNEICDLTPLDDLDSLRVLHLEHNNLGCDGSGLSPNFDSLINSQSLEELYLNDNELESISGLAGKDLPLRILHLENNLISDISPIDGFDLITDLYLFNNQISDISNLSQVDGISSIDLSNNQIVDISPLLLIENLERIDLSNNQISVIPDISDSWPFLSVLDLHSNPLTDTGGINGHETLEELILYNSGMTSLQGISNLPELDTLVIFSELEADLEPLDQNPNNISNIINSFNNTPSLTLDEEGIFDFGFELGENVRIIDSISGLDGIGRINFVDMDIIEINENSIALEDLEILDVSDNRIEDIAFVFNNPNLIHINASNNLISNLELINGTDTEDLHQLLDFVANNNTASNNLDGAFIDLPEIQLIDLTNTSIVSINNSFNNLEELSLLYIDSTDLETITNSFNNIFGTYADTNQFVFTEGNIGVIDNSFNNGVYDIITIQNQTPTGSTYISSSFNNLNVSNEEGITIEGNTFELIEDSFNGSTETLMQATQIDMSNNNTVSVDNAFNYINIPGQQGVILSVNNIDTINNSFNQSTIPNIDLANNLITLITLSFEDTTVSDEISLNNNLIQSINDLNLIGFVETIDLSNNRLSTLSFLDGIVGLANLDISSQINQETLSYTLVSIDGVNNMPSLDNLIYDNIGVTEIDGLKNIGIDTFNLSFNQNDNVTIHTISSTSFEGTDITYLDLDNHQITTFDYLDNLPNLTNLYIGLDIGDLTGFDAFDMADNLEVLVIHDVEHITDFTPLAVYDTLTSLTYETDAITDGSIQNLSGLDNVSVLNIVNPLVITTIENSFNQLPNLILPADYLNNYPSLTITDSFDIYTSQTLELNALHTSINSFNNVLEVSVFNNAGILTPNFDTDSFDSIEFISFDSGDYTSYTFLNGYTALNSIEFSSLSTDITDLNNANVIDLTLNEIANAVNNLSFTISNNGAVSISSIQSQTLTITSNNTELSLDATNMDIFLDTVATNLNILGTSSTLDISGVNMEAINFDDYQTNDLVLTGDNLSTITQTLDELLTSTLNVTSAVALLNYNMNVNTLTINNDLANDLTIDVGNGNAVLNSLEPSVSVDYTGNDLTITQASLESLNLNGLINQLTIDSALLDTVALNDTIISDANISSNQETMSISGSNVQSLTVDNDSISDLTAALATTPIFIYTDNTNPLSLDVVGGDVTMVASFIPNLTLSNATTVQTLNLSTAPQLSNLIMNDASITDIDLNTDVVSFVASGTATSTFNIVASNSTSFDLNIPSMSLIITDSANVVTFDLNAQSLEMTDIGLSNLTINSGSTVGAIDLNGTNSIGNVNLNDVAVDTLDIDSFEFDFTLDAVNALTTTLSGANFNTLDIDLGTNDLTIISSKTTSIGSINMNAGNVLLNTSLSSYTFTDTTIIETLTLQSDNNGTIIFGDATINNLTIDGSSNSLFVDGTNIAATDIIGTFTNLNMTLNDTALTVDSNALTTVTITTDGTSMDLSTTSTTIINSATQSDISVSGAGEDITFNLSATNLDFTLDGTMNSAYISGNNLDTITFGDGSVIDTLTLDNTNVSSVDEGTSSITNLNYSTALSSVTVLGDSYQNVSLSGDSLQTINYTNISESDTLTIDTNNTVLNIIGQTSDLVVVGDNLTSVSLGSITASTMSFTSDALSAINTSSFVGNLTLNINQDNFNITTDASSVILNGNTTYGFVLNVPSATSLSMTTDFQDGVINATDTNITLDAINLEAITGTMSALTINDIDNTIFTLNASVNSLEFGPGITVDTVDITSSTLLGIDTNDATITNLSTALTLDNAVITTLASNVVLNGNTTHQVTLNSDSAETQTITTTNQSLILNVPNGDTIVSGVNLETLLGDTTTLTLLDTDDDSFTYNGSLDTMSFGPGITITTLDITSDTLLDIDTNDATITNLTTSLGSDNAEITTLASSINLNGESTHQVTLNSAITGLQTITTTNQTLIIDIPLGNLNITGSNLDSLIGDADNITLLETNATSFAYDGSVNTMVFDGVYAVDTIDITSDTLTTLDTTNVVITTLTATTNASSNAVTTNASNSTLSLDADTINITLDALSNAAISTTSLDPVNITTNTINNLVITMSNANVLNITADTENTQITGALLDTINPSDFIINNTLTINDSLLTSLDFLDNTMITSLDTIVMNTLSVDEIENVITLIGNTTITLTSPITDADVYDYYYDQEIIDLTAQEAIDNVRYDGFRDTEITAIYNFIITNEYMDQIDETTLRNQIDTQSYLTTEEYFQLFLDEQGVTEAEYGETESATARASIQATLDDPTLVINETELNDAVTASIETDADLNATASQNALTFTLN